MWCVYLITRDDNQKYVGKTSLMRLKNRMSAHKKDDVFVGHIFKYEILSIADSHDEILEYETHYVQILNTFENGLNKTKHGKGFGHSSSKFTTLGKEFTEEHKQKMRDNHWSKTGAYKPTGVKHSEETKKIISDKKKNTVSYTKITEVEVRKLIELYFSKLILDDVGKVLRNGKLLSYERAFSKMHSVRFGITSTAIYNIIKGKVGIWNPILSEIKEKYKF